MKHIYVPTQKPQKTQKRQAIEREALTRLREVRAKFQKEHPGLLSGIKERYQAMQQAQKQTARPAPPQRPKTETIIDRAKNLETIAKFLQITDSEQVKKALREGL